MKIYILIFLLITCTIDCISQSYSNNELTKFKSNFLSSIDYINKNWKDTINKDFSFNYQYSKVNIDSLEFTFYRVIIENDTIYRRGFTLKKEKQNFGFIFDTRTGDNLQDIIYDINPDNLLSILFFEKKYVPTKVLKFYQAKIYSSILVIVERNNVKLLNQIYLELIRYSSEININNLITISKRYSYNPFFKIYDSISLPQNSFFLWEKLSLYRPGPIIDIND